MQCANLLKRRSLDTEVEPWSCKPKRVCVGAELRLSERPMETTLSFSSNQQPAQQVCVPPSGPPLCCPRCLGGEPGHINHILGL